MTRYQLIPEQVKRRWTSLFQQNILFGFDECVFETLQLLEQPGVYEFFIEQQGRLTTFFKESGINETWNEIIERRANDGLGIVEQIYEYARSMNMEDHLIPYTRSEKIALNMLADSNYELIKNVTAEEVAAIRRQLVQDFSNGTYPLQTSLKEIQLKPINNFSPESRAEMIARTETARVLNVSTLEVMRGDGVSRVALVGCDPACESCAEYADGVSIDEALSVQVPHPHCTGSWIALRDEESGFFTGSV